MNCHFCDGLVLNGTRLQRDGTEWVEVHSSVPRPTGKDTCRNCARAVLLNDKEEQ